MHVGYPDGHKCGNFWRHCTSMASIDEKKEDSSISNTPEPVIRPEVFNNEEKFKKEVKENCGKFKTLHEEYINWFKSPASKRLWPKRVYLSKSGKSGFRQRVQKYTFDERTSVLFRQIKNSDGICKYNFSFKIVKIGHQKI